MKSDTQSSEMFSDLLQEIQKKEAVQWVLHELEKDIVLSSPEVDHIYDGITLDKRLWEPLFGGELNQLWDSILKNPGDEIIVKGSTVLKIALGVYPVDKNTGLAPASMRSDIDIVATTEEVSQRIKEAGFVTRDTTISTDIEVGELAVGMVTYEDLKRMDLAALDDLNVWVESLESEERRDYYASKIDSFKGLVNDALPDDFLKIHSMFPHEAMHLKLRRNDKNDLVVEFRDPVGVLDDRAIKYQMSKYRERGDYFGLVLNMQNESSLRSIFLEAFLEMDNFEFSSKLPLFVLESITRLSTADCLSDIQYYGDEGSQVYDALYRVARRMASGDNIFSVKLPETGKTYDANEWFLERVQKSLAEGSLSSLEGAYAYTFMYLPLGGAISSDVGRYFGQFHNYVYERTGSPPGNDLIYHYRGQNFQEWMDKNPPKASFLLYMSLVSRYYGMEKKPLIDISKGVENKDTRSNLTFAEVERFPANMSEVFATILVSLGWHPDHQSKLIDESVANWKPTGMLKKSWKRGEYDFNIGVERDLVYKRMREIYDDLNNLRR